MRWNDFHEVLLRGRGAGARLGISTKTIETYKARIAEKLGLTSRTEIVRYALQRGWLSAEG